MGFLPPYLTSDFSLGRGRARAALTELLVGHIGDLVHQTPYLIVCPLVQAATQTNFILA